MTTLSRFIASCLVATFPVAVLRAAEATPPVVIERAPEADANALQREIAALRTQNARITAELRDAQWALGEARTRIDELAAEKSPGAVDSASLAAEKARADEANARLATLVAGANQLSAEKNTLESRLAAATKAESDLRQQLAAAQQAAAATPPPPSVPPEMVSKLADTEARLADRVRRNSLLQSENELLKTAASDHARLSADVQNLRQEKTTWEARLAEAQSAGVGALSAADAETLSRRLADTESKLQTVLRSYSQLEAELAQAKLTTGQSSAQSAELETLRRQNAALEARIAATPADQSREVAAKLAENENRLATVLRSYSQVQAELEQTKATAGQQTDQSAELETLRQEKAALEARIAAMPPDESHHLASKLADTEDRLSTTLRSYTLQQREIDQLKSDAAEATLAAQAASTKASNDSATQISALFDELRQTQARANALVMDNSQLKTRLALVGPPPGSTMASPSRPGTAQATAAAATPASPAASPLTETPARAPEPRTHVVKLGDNLGRISRQYYGTPARWEEILRANPDVIKNENVLTVGTPLRIP